MELIQLANQIFQAYRVIFTADASERSPIPHFLVQHEVSSCKFFKILDILLELNETLNKRKPLKLSMYEAVIETRDGDTLFLEGMPISGVSNTQKDAPLMESCATLC